MFSFVVVGLGPLDYFWALLITFFNHLQSAPKETQIATQRVFFSF
jgi:hypothetical protein